MRVPSVWKRLDKYFGDRQRVLESFLSTQCQDQQLHQPVVGWVKLKAVAAVGFGIFVLGQANACPRQFSVALGISRSHTDRLYGQLLCQVVATDVVRRRSLSQLVAV